MTLRRFYLATIRAQRFLVVIWLGAAAVLVLDVLIAIAFLKADRPVPRWAALTNGPDTLLAAVGFDACCVLSFFLGCTLVVAAFRFVIRRIALRDSVPMQGTVVSSRQTGTMVNNRPVMEIRVQVQGRSGPFVTTSRKLLDLGSIPRAGDQIKVDVSRAISGLSVYRGPA